MAPPPGARNSVSPVLVTWLIFPLLLGALCAGLGLLVERAAGVRLARALVVPLGLAGMVALAGLATMWGPAAPLATPAVVAGAVAGLALGARDGRLHRPRTPWPLVAALGVYALYAAPLVLAGAHTFGGYIKLDDTASWLNITDHVMSHGRDVGDLAPSSYAANLDFYLHDTGYPIGSFLPLGVGHQLLGQDSAWLFQPYETFLAALLALVLYAALAGVVERPWLRALMAWLAAQPALLVGYAMWGGVKEMAAAVLVPLVAVLVVRALGPDARPREGIAPAVACGALVGVLGLGAGPWLAPPLLVAGVVLARRRAGGRLVAVFAPAALVLSLPAVVVAGAFIRGGLPTFTGEGFSSRYANLFQPLSPFQLAGIWPSGDFRVFPDPLWPAVLLIAVALAAAAWGAIGLWRTGRWAPVLYAGPALVACAIIGVVAQPWLVAKAFAQAAPAILLLALVGAARVPARLRPLGLALGALVAGGVLWSNALAYTQVTPAPGDRFAELERVAEHVGDRGPALVTEPEIYADRHFLREADPEGAGDLRPRQVALSGGQTLLNGAWADVDAFFPASLVPYDTLVVRRSPVASRPPTPYRLTRRGHWYETWQRPGRDAGDLIEHDGLGDNFARPYCGKGSAGVLGRCGIQPAAVPPCAQVMKLAASARRRGGDLRAVRRQNPVVVEADRMRAPGRWLLDPSRGWLSPVGAGTARASVAVPRAGRYEAWIGGSFSRSIAVSLDGRPLGSVAWQPSNYGQYVRLRAVRLTAGPHTVAVRAASPGLHPGSAESRPDFNHVSAFVLAPAGSDRGRPFDVLPARARSLCGQSLDWIEVVKGRSVIR
jgi:hypothetical protein